MPGVAPLKLRVMTGVIGAGADLVGTWPRSCGSGPRNEKAACIATAACVMTNFEGGYAIEWRAFDLLRRQDLLRHIQVRVL